MLEISEQGIPRYRAENNKIDFSPTANEISRKAWTLITATTQKNDTGYRSKLYINGQAIESANDMPGFRGQRGWRGDGLTGRDTNQSGVRNSGSGIRNSG